MNREASSGKYYIPHLDALRGLAILMVVGFHANVPGFSGGYIGVDLFFVLSGYLVTKSLILDPCLARFYLKRVRRLVPALALMLFIYCLIFSILRPDHPNVRDALIAFFYLSDYSAAYWGIPQYLIHTWSLAVEEHFYILWPLVFLGFKLRFWHVLLMYGMFSVWRWAQSDWLVTYYSFDTRLSGLLLGCALAYLNINIKYTSLSALILIGVCCGYYISGEPLFQDWGVVIVEFSAAMLIVARPPVGLSNPVLIYIGRVSYGVYLWHYPIIRLLEESGAGWPVMFAIGLSISMICAAMSYHYFEPLFWKKRPDHLSPLGFDAKLKTIADTHKP